VLAGAPGCGRLASSLAMIGPMVGSALTMAALILSIKARIFSDNFLFSAARSGFAWNAAVRAALNSCHSAGVIMIWLVAVDGTPEGGAPEKGWEGDVVFDTACCAQTVGARNRTTIRSASCFMGDYFGLGVAAAAAASLR